MSKVSLCISNGHRGALNGQTGTAGEVDLIDKVFYAIKAIIDQNYSDKITLYYDDANLNNIKALGNNLNYAVFLHFDGSTNPAYDGGFVDDSPTDQVSIQSWKFAQTVADHYFGPMGIRFAPEHRTVNSTNYYAFNFTGENTKQFIIECGTLTNTHDRTLLQDYNKIGKLIMEGVVAYFKATEAIFTNPSPIPPTGGDQATINGLRQQLQIQKDAYNTLQQSTTQKIADLTKQCQDYKDKANSLIAQVIGLLHTL